MNFDADNFLPYLDESDLSKEEKLEIIHIVWNFIELQIDEAFGIHPVQLIDNHVKEGLQERPLQLESRDRLLTNIFSNHKGRPTLQKDDRDNAK